MNNDRNFKGVWMPKEIWLSKDLTPLEKCYLVEIDSLDDEENGCYASNKHFEEIFGQKGSNISRVIENLRLKGWIEVEYIYSGNEIEKRVIRVNRPPYPVKYYKNDEGYAKNEQGGTLKISRGYAKNDYERKTYIEEQYNNIYIYSRVIDYLNEKTGSKYKASTSKTKSLINARVREGFTEEDFKKVIDIKSKEWMNTDMQKYLRPETLFGTKFEGYLNQKGKKTFEDMLNEVWEDNK